MRHRWTYQDDQAFRELWASGASNRDLAERFNCSESAVKMHRVMLNLTPRFTRKKKLPKPSGRIRKQPVRAVQLFSARNGNFDSSRAAYWLAELWRAA